ncbi:MAG TPA: T9SS type A sorting domain-containing protein, partial [Ignavibacteria bacterium]|nr:T9SS type A sorting domain-containing protein [Ignavibacteria bacterium]
NAGLNWYQVFAGGGANNYADITFINDSTGFQCRFTILKTTDNGSSWFTLSHTSRQRTKFSKVFGDTMYLASANGYVAKSINLGANWTENFTGINQLLTDIHFIDNQLGFAIGDSGGIVKTTNGGSNWIIQNSGTNKKLNELWFINKDTGFIAGDSGLLLVTYNGGVTSLSQNYQSTPEKFQLHQNFPNPFNPSTIIRFDLVQSGYTRLSIYDVSGKKITVLVDANLSPGSYEYNFNAENLPSGVYFYKIESEAFTETKRMILIK